MEGQKSSKIVKNHRTSFMDDPLFVYHNFSTKYAPTSQIFEGHVLYIKDLVKVISILVLLMGSNLKFKVSSKTTHILRFLMSFPRFLIYRYQGCRKQGAGRTVNPISTRGADYAHHSTTSPLGFSDIATALYIYFIIIRILIIKIEGRNFSMLSIS